MNQWYFLFGMLFVIALFGIGTLICIVLLIKRFVKKERKKPIIFSVTADILLLFTVIIYTYSHSTYYKYNDLAILQSNIHMIEQKYGEFDLGKIKENEEGRVAYYIYTDNGPIMPDHLKHYYYMEYDTHGVVHNVYDAAEPGS